MFYFNDKAIRVFDFVRLIQLEDNQIKIQMKNYYLILDGMNFRINYFEGKEIVILGTISNIKIQ